MEEERLALDWVAHLTGKDEFRRLDTDSAVAQFQDWYRNSFEPDFNLVSSCLRSMPDLLLTSRFQNEVRQFVRCSEAIHPILERLVSGKQDIGDSMSQIRRHFNDNADQLDAWQTQLVNLAAVMRWIPKLENLRSYISGTFPATREDLDYTRTRLLELLDQPHRFLKPRERETFEHVFLEYKAQYIDYYSSSHEEVLQIVGKGEKKSSKVDATALRNLELLSGLRYTDQSYLHRVRIIGKWLQRNKCALPVRKVLDRYPRCCCGFNPETSRQLTHAANQINTVVQEGIDYFRAALRGFKRIIIEDLKELKADDSNSRQIAAILSSSPMIPISAGSIEILNKIIQNHSREFLAWMRTLKP